MCQHHGYNILASIGVLGPLSSHDISDCCDCILEKMFSLLFNKNVTRSFASFDLIHYDVWGPYPLSYRGGSKYYI